MDKTYILPKSINGSSNKPGLKVNYINVSHINFEMTSFDIKFPADGPKQMAEKRAISGRYFDELAKAFKTILLKIGYKEEEIFIVNIYRTGVLLNITKHFDKDEALQLVSDVCNEILSLSEDALEYYEHIHNKIMVYLDLIINQKQYNYSNINFAYLDSKYIDLNI